MENRDYYCMFYAILALIDEPFASYKHSGVLSYFNRRFIREGIFPEEIEGGLMLCCPMTTQVKKLPL